MFLIHKIISYFEQDHDSPQISTLSDIVDQYKQNQTNNIIDEIDHKSPFELDKESLDLISNSTQSNENLNKKIEVENEIEIEKQNENKNENLDDENEIEKQNENKNENLDDENEIEIEKQNENVSENLDNELKIKKEKETRSYFDKIAEMELKNGFDVSSFDNLPDLFMNIETKTFGETLNNPFYKLKEIAMNCTYSFQIRTQAVRYMQRITHIDLEKATIDAAISIVKDNQYTIEQRYHFFSNNEAFIKLDYHIVNACHFYLYQHFAEMNIPLLYKILSAQYLLACFLETKYDRREVQMFLIGVAEDPQQSINYRAECADILYRHGVEKEFVERSQKVIRDLGELYEKNKVKTIYTNAQNVHDETVTKQVIETLRKLITHKQLTEVLKERNTGQIMEMLETMSKDDREVYNKRCQVMYRIMIDTAKYENLCLSDILLLVWDVICCTKDKESKQTLELRLCQELDDMFETCSSGHLSRILNVLSGFFVDSVVKISLSDQLRSNIFARYTKLIEMLSEERREKILHEMTLENPNEKDTIKMFLCDCCMEEQLFDEFVQNGDMQVSEFYNVYEKAMDDYFGKLHE